jgi:alpha-L-rhamnosidase
VPVVSPVNWREGADVYPLWPCWESTFPLLTWYLYDYYGDRQVLEDHYEGIKKLVGFLSANASDYIISVGLGDHMEPQEDGFSHFSPRHTPAGLTSTGYYYYDALLLGRMATVLQRREDATNYLSLAAKIKESFNRHFFDITNDQYATGSQTSNALALYLGLVPKDDVQPVLNNLTTDITEKHNNHISTGIIGSNAIAQVLPSYNADLMYKIATETTYPSLGYQVVQGATTICETYECSAWLSQNMKMFGSLDKFFYRNLAGITLLSPGYRQVRIKPQPVGDLRHVSAWEDTVHGKVSIDWTKGDASLDLDVTIPAGMEAEIEIPSFGMGRLNISEGGKSVWQRDVFVPGVAGLSGGTETHDGVSFHAGSGSYKFVMTGSFL